MKRSVLPDVTLIGNGAKYISFNPRVCNVKKKENREYNFTKIVIEL